MNAFVRDHELRHRNLVGTLDAWLHHQGYGFALVPKLGKVLVHENSLKECGLHTPEEGDQLTMDVVTSGPKARCIKVRRIDSARRGLGVDDLSFEQRGMVEAAVVRKEVACGFEIDVFGYEKPVLLPNHVLRESSVRATKVGAALTVLLNDAGDRATHVLPWHAASKALAV